MGIWYTLIGEQSDLLTALYYANSVTIESLSAPQVWGFFFHEIVKMFPRIAEFLIDIVPTVVVLCIFFAWLAFFPKYVYHKLRP